MPDACVFAPTLILTITIEAGDGEFDELHFHPGGQGFWIARMLGHLGARPVVVAPLGGESGDVLHGLAPAWGVDLAHVASSAPSPAYVHDRRSGERREIARSRPPPLNRHEVDDLYGRVLDVSTRSGVCVVTGKYPGDMLPLSFYSRLGADLAATGVTAIGDLHGDELDAFLKGGRLHTLKLSDEDLEHDGALEPDAPEAARIEALKKLQGRGASRIVLSSAEHATLAVFDDRWLRTQAPLLSAVDARGSGDTMTAGLVAATLRGMDPEETLRLACAAGAANATRHGLGNADSQLVASLATRVRVEEL